MKLTGAGFQSRQDNLHRADLSLSGSAQLVLARSQARSYLLLANAGVNTMWIEFGAGAAHCSISSGAVGSSITIDNAGFGFTLPPVVRFRGGGFAQNGKYLGLNQPGGEAPTDVATGIATLSAGAISAITLTHAGSLYAIAPYIELFNDDLDPYGCSVPAANSGIPLLAGGKLEWNGTVCPTSPVAVIGTSGDKLIARWME